MLDMSSVSEMLLPTMDNNNFNHHNDTTNNTTNCEVTALKTTLTVIYTSIIVLVVLLNTSIFISLKPFIRKRRRSNLEIFLIYLAVFDLLASVMLVSQVYQEMTCDYNLGRVGCNIVYPTYQISLNMSICILIIMAVDRCRALRYPTRRRFSKQATHVIVGIAFVVSVLSQMYQFLSLRQDEEGNCIRDRAQLTFGVPRIVITVVRDSVFIVVAVMTSITTCRALKSSNSNANNNKNNIPNSIEHKQRKAYQRLTMINTMQMVFGALVIPYDVFDCFMQIVVMADININFQLIEVSDIILSILQMCSSFANCFVFAKMYRCLATTSRRTTNAEDDDDNGETTVEVNYTYPQDML